MEDFESLSREELIARLKIHAKAEALTTETTPASNESAATAYALLHHSPTAILRFDRNFRIAYVNRTALKWVGDNADRLMGRTLEETALSQELIQLFHEALQRVFTDKTPQEREFELQFDKGSAVFHTCFVPEILADGSVPFALMNALDITQRKRAEQKLMESELRLQMVLDAMPVILTAVDKNLQITAWNTEAERVTGYLRQEILNNPDAMKLLIPDRKSRRWLIEENRRRDGCYRNLWFDVQCKDGSIKTLSCSNVSKEAHIPGWLGWATAIDVTEQKLTQARIEHLARHDVLTGLPNRALLRDRLEQALALAHRYGQQIGVMFIDLDRFKQINDSLGHEVGDEVLKKISLRLRSCVREADTVARAGGDEFVVMLPDLTDTDAAVALGMKLLENVARPFTAGGHSLQITPSVGISVYPHHGQDADSLLRNADAAMYWSKQNGRGRVCLYSSDLVLGGIDALAKEAALRSAIEHGEFVLHYQPLINLTTGKTVGAEALLRWQHPEWGLLMPTEFIPFAEERGLMQEIGHWVVHAVCEQVAGWRKQGLDSFRVAINISALQLQTAGLADTLQQAFLATGVSPTCLELELTETALMENIEAASLLLQQLKQLGISVAIDDFGTGYSSLSYLQQLPLDKVKIDRSFVRGLADNKNSITLTTAIIGLANNLNLKVTAEGVETRDQDIFLKAQQCDYGQGFFYGKPMWPQEFFNRVSLSRNLTH